MAERRLDGDRARVTQGPGAKAIATAVRLAGPAFVLLFSAAPAAANGEARAVLSVTATVVPACSVEREPAGRYGAAIACSTGATVTTRTARGHDERPLDEASAILGAPLRRRGDVVFTAPVRAASPAAAGAPARPQYFTITY